MKKDVNVNVLATTNDYNAVGENVKGFDRLEAQLQRIKALHKQGAPKETISDAINEIVVDTIVDPLSDSIDGELYDWKSPLGHLVDVACGRIRNAHNLDNRKHLEYRVDVMLTVFAWLVNPEIVLRISTQMKMTTWLSARISWNGYEAGCKDVGDIYNIHVANVPKYDKDTGKKIGMWDVYTIDVSDVEVCDDEETSVFDRTEGVGMISRNPENVVVGDDSDDAMILDAVAEGIAVAVRSFCDTYAYNYGDLERYCADYEARRSSDLLSAKNYGDANKILARMSNNKFYKTKITNLIKNELITRNVPIEFVEHLTDLPWNTPDRDNCSGLRDVIRAGVAVAARRYDGVVV